MQSPNVYNSRETRRGTVVAVTAPKGGSGKTSLIEYWVHRLGEEPGFKGKCIVLDISGTGSCRLRYNLARDDNHRSDLSSVLSWVDRAARDSDPSLTRGKLIPTNQLNWEEDISYSPPYDLNAILPRYIQKINDHVDIVIGEGNSNPYAYMYEDALLYARTGLLIEKLRSNYQYIFLDMPSSVSVISSEIFSHVDHVIFPFPLSNSFRVMDNLLDLDQEIQKQIFINRKSIYISGIVPMFYTPKPGEGSAQDQAVIREMKNLFGDLVWSGVPHNRKSSYKPLNKSNPLNNFHDVIFQQLMAVIDVVPTKRTEETLLRGEMILKAINEIREKSNKFRLQEGFEYDEYNLEVRPYQKIATYLQSEQSFSAYGGMEKISLAQIRHALNASSIFKYHSLEYCEGKIRKALGLKKLSFYPRTAFSM